MPLMSCWTKTSMACAALALRRPPRFRPLRRRDVAAVAWPSSLNRGQVQRQRHRRRGCAGAIFAIDRERTSSTSASRAGFAAVRGWRCVARPAGGRVRAVSHSVAERVAGRPSLGRRCCSTPAGALPIRASRRSGVEVIAWQRGYRALQLSLAGRLITARSSSIGRSDARHWAPRPGDRVCCNGRCCGGAALGMRSSPTSTVDVPAGGCAFRRAIGDRAARMLIKIAVVLLLGCRPIAGSWRSRCALNVTSMFNHSNASDAVAVAATACIAPDSHR